MSFYLGRVGLPTASGGDGLTMPEPFTWEQNGDVIQLGGIQYGLSETNLLWWRDQMLGLRHENGEDAFPVRSSVVSGFDGYYKLLDVGVSHPQGSLNGGTLHATWAVQLQRLQQWRQPRHELLGAFGQLTNAYGVTGALVSAAPPNVVDWDFGGDLVTIFTGGTTLTTRSVDAGNTTSVSLNVVEDTSPGTSGRWTGRYLGVLANHYHGACKVEYDAASDGTYRHVIGYRVFNSAAETALARLSNGLVRASVSTTSLNVSHWDGTQWDTAVATNIVYLGTTTTLTFLRAAVLKNTPTICVIRCYCQLSSGASLLDRPFQVDLSIRRGLRAVFIRVTRGLNSPGQWRLQFASAVACTSINSGSAIRQTSNNASGNRVVLSGQDAATLDLVNGRISQASTSDEFMAAVTCEVGGSGATGIDAATSQGLETFVLASEQQRTVGY